MDNLNSRISMKHIQHLPMEWRMNTKRINKVSLGNCPGMVT